MADVIYRPLVLGGDEPAGGRRFSPQASLGDAYFDLNDPRVADFMRLVPGASASQKLSLNDGLAVARRAGAGRLVMGDVLKVGSRTMVTATVFDVRRGSRLRSAREETALQDSLIPLFSRLARGILAVAPPAGANLGAIGTSSVSAFQEYLAGVQALNRFELPVAKRHLTRALQLDTNFALAHYKLAVAGSYDDADAALRVSQVSLSDTLTMQRMITSYLAADAASLSKVVDDPASLAHAISAARMSGVCPCASARSSTVWSRKRRKTSHAPATSMAVSCASILPTSRRCTVWASVCIRTSRSSPRSATRRSYDFGPAGTPHFAYCAASCGLTHRFISPSTTW